MIQETKFFWFAQVANDCHYSDEFRVLMRELMGNEVFEAYADAYASSKDFYFYGRKVLSGGLALKDFEAMIKRGCFEKFLAIEDSRQIIHSEDEKKKLVVESDGSCTIKDNNRDFF